jgi:hypothetical protein
MIILCITPLIVGFLLKLTIVWTVGIVVLAVGLILVLLGALGALGREVGAAGITSGPRRAC